MAGQASEFHHGEMDTHAQRATFKAVMTGTKWASLVLAVGVLFFVMWFCTTAGFGAAFISAFVLAVVGVFALRARPSAH